MIGLHSRHRILFCSKRHVVGLAGCLLLGCKEHTVDGRVCSTEARAGIQIAIRDAITGAPAATGALAVAYDGPYSDTLRGVPMFDSLTVFGVFERPGTYTAIVSKSGYHDWIHSNIVVRKDECHVIPVILEAQLNRM